MATSADLPLVDRRLFIGILVVMGTQGLVWLTAGIMLFGAGGTALDYFGVGFLGMVIAVPFAVVAFTVALGPGVALWIGMMAVGRFARLTERQSALIAAPMVALMVSTGCLLAFAFSIGQQADINRDLVLAIMLFSIPALVTAEAYAFLAWPRSSKQGENCA